ncbi:MAG: hypothetical protein ACREM9_06740 [Gemmatimonadales bacterium]
MGTGDASDHRSWHALLAPLPDGATPRTSPLVAPGAPASPDTDVIAGWESLVLELSAGAAGLRILQVLRDGHGQPLSASDHVLYRSVPSDHRAAVQIRQESIGGRFEPNGDFKGTCWLVTGPEPVDEEAPEWEMTPREPKPDEVAALRRLVEEVIRRQAGP